MILADTWGYFVVLLGTFMYLGVLGSTLGVLGDTWGYLELLEGTWGYL